MQGQFGEVEQVAFRDGEMGLFLDFPRCGASERAVRVQHASRDLREGERARCDAWLHGEDDVFLVVAVCVCGLDDDL